MSRTDLDSKCKLCRREKVKLFLKGEKCFSPKCTLAKKPNLPGKTMFFSSRLSTYGERLREKQKVKRIYGLNEAQMKRFLEKATSAGGDKGLRLLQLLEMRIDNVVYKLGLSSSRNLARQMVNHGNISVNGKKVTIPSYIVSEGDKVEILNQKVQPSGVAEMKPPAWLVRKGRGGQVVSTPTREAIDEGIREYLVVEFYSR